MEIKQVKEEGVSISRRRIIHVKRLARRSRATPNPLTIKEIHQDETLFPGGIGTYWQLL